MNRNLSRRAVISAGTGLIIGLHLPWTQKGFAAPMAENKDYSSPNLPNAFVKIAQDNSVTIIINKLEMGQGVYTSLAQLIAEELECDWHNISCEHAPVAPVYNHFFAPTQFVGGSSSVATSWEQLRRVGAMARSMLVQAAAKKWGVAPGSCQVNKGVISHIQKGQLTFGAVAVAAQKETPPSSIVLKDHSKFKIIGQSMPRIDAPTKNRGEAIYGLDVRVPGMVYASMAHPPFGGSLIKADSIGLAKAVPGVLEVLVLGDQVAVVATTTYSAIKGREALKLSWNLPTSPLASSDGQRTEFTKLLSVAGTPVIQNADTEANLKKSAKIMEMDYEFPWLAHASMEPLNCTVDFDGKHAKVWSAHQMPTSDRQAAASTLGIPVEQVDVITTFAGGSFGRRASKANDFVVNACLIAKSLKRPVKLVYTREDDMQGGFYRPYTLHRAKLGLNAQGQLIAWQHKIVGQSVMKGSRFDAKVKETGIDNAVVEGVQGSAYQIPAMSIELHLPETPVSSLWWRSVGHTHTAYVMETIMDQLAESSKVDPLTFRRRFLGQSPRHIAVLDLLEKSSFWREKPISGHTFGLAIHESFKTVVGQVVDVSLGKDQKTPTVHRVDAAVHCGVVVNPTVATSQVEGAIAFGLSACLYQQLTIVRGQVQEGNFHNFPILRMPEMPVTRVFFVPSTDAPTGLGEPGLPPTAPAVANALYLLTQKRLGKLPFVI